MLKIDFYYWGEQCPHNSRMRHLLSSLDSREYDVNFYDITDDHQTAKRLNIYSPTLMIFNDELRWNGPITIDIIHKISKGDIPKAQPYQIEQSNNLLVGSTKFLTEETVFDTCTPCMGGKEYYYDKSEWIKKTKKDYGIEHLGILHYYNEKCVGGAEYVPSIMVPYPIPKGKDIAFLTCLYLSDKNIDYKSYPLNKLETELFKLGYKTLLAIVSEEVVFPNGTLKWFIDKEYVDLGELYYEERDFARMHLVKKDLISNIFQAVD